MADDKAEELFKQLKEIDMVNAKGELLSHLERNKSIIKCATINCSLSDWYREELTEEWNNRGAAGSKDYEILTAEISTLIKSAFRMIGSDS